MPNFYFSEREADALVTFLMGRRPPRVTSNLIIDYDGSPLGKIAAGRLPESVAGVMQPEAVNGHFESTLASGSEPQAILRSFLDAQIPVERFEVALPTLNDIFIEEVRHARSRG